jgi:dTDP-glucose pyrophosphorylase
MRIILPMAGYGRRFREQGYTAEKPLIEVNGKTLLEWALEPIPKEWEPIVVARQDQPYELFVDYVSQGGPGAHLGKGRASVIALPGPTGGASMTVLAAAVALPPDEPVAVMNCDQWFQCDLEAATRRALTEAWDGYILVFDGSGPQWSYAICNSARTDKVVGVVEKPAVQPPHSAPTVGFYWWRKAADLVWTVCQMIGANDAVNGEYYLAPSYNRLLRWGAGDVRAVPVDEFVGLGTPEQVRSFEQAALVREP